MKVEIIGCRGKIKDKEEFIKKLKRFGEKKGMACQIMDASKVYGREHVISAVEHAVRAFRNETNSCRTLDLEILLYASGKRQIKDAIDFMGAGDSGEFVFVAVSSSGENEYKSVVDFLEEEGFEIDDEIIRGNEETLKRFGITEGEIKSVDKSMYGDLILEKVAIVDIIK